MWAVWWARQGGVAPDPGLLWAPTRFAGTSVGPAAAGRRASALGAVAPGFPQLCFVHCAPSLVAPLIAVRALSVFKVTEAFLRRDLVCFCGDSCFPGRGPGTSFTPSRGVVSGSARKG